MSVRTLGGVVHLLLPGAVWPGAVADRPGLLPRRRRAAWSSEVRSGKGGRLCHG